MIALGNGFVSEIGLNIKLYFPDGQTSPGWHIISLAISKLQVASKGSTSWYFDAVPLECVSPLVPFDTYLGTTKFLRLVIELAIFELSKSPLFFSMAIIELICCV